ncbi:MAG TPA: methyltransferase domain-containing protein [Ignavibacteria bacterium]
MKCILCNNETITINWGKTPIAGYKVNTIKESLEQPAFPLDMMFCPNCNFTRYKQYPGMKKIFKKLYKEQESTYSISQKISSYIQNLITQLSNKYNLSSKSTILEIGCNDGSLLHYFNKIIGCKTLGIEPSTHFKDIWDYYGLNVYNEFFTSKTLGKINKKINLIILRHVLEHISDLNEIIENIASILTKNSILIIEVPYLKTIINSQRLENISHPHINYFSIKSMNELISKFSLGIKEFNIVPTDGGSILFHIMKNYKTDKSILDNIIEKDFIKLKDFYIKRKYEITKILKEYSKNEIVGAGAGAKGSHLIYLFELEKFIDIVFDVQSNFFNKYIPNTKIVIKPEDYNPRILKAVINLAPTHTEKIKHRIPKKLKLINIIKNK